MTLLRLVVVATVLLLCPLVHNVCIAADTVRVKTLTFDDITKRSGTWQFPPPQPYEKVLLEYTLKCDQRTTQDQYPCGEWDYLTYIVLTDSTGEWDSTGASQVNYIVHGTTPDSLPYATDLVNRKRRYHTTTVSRTSFGDWISLGTNDQANATILQSGGGRAQYVILASELTDAGIAAGPISGLRLTAMDSGAVNILTIQLANTTSTKATSPMSVSNATVVVNRSVILDDTENQLAFERPFSWDGTSNVLVDIACFSADADIRLVAGGAPAQGVIADPSRHALLFEPGDKLTLPTGVGSALSKQVTIAFWSYGNPQRLPANHNAFEAYDARGRRVLNAHVPWSDGTVYWDAGRNDGQGPDRISKAATPQQYEGGWHHWAFVKNAETGTMQIYLDGVLFAEGSGKTLGMSSIASFVFGTGASGAYPGMLDEIQIWKKALDSATIRTWMTKKLTVDHPDFNDLVAYYDCESQLPDGRLKDGSANGYHAELWGMPVRETITHTMLGYLTLSSTARPFLGLEPGSSLGTNTREDVTVLTARRTTNVVLYGNPVEPRIYALDDPNHPSLPTDTLAIQEAGWIPVYDESWLKVDSFFVAPTTTLRKQVGKYYSPIAQFELGRYITPYGIGLDLGDKGFKWVYDVTDFAPLLRGNVTLSAGNQQELIDMTFLFIKGKPAREVKQIDQVWYERGAYFPDVLSNKALAPQTISLNPAATTFRLKAVTSGHEFDNPTNCAEFCRRTHFYNVDGQERFTWDVWKECGDNPVYPQGGTWLIDRTGWCPGAPVDLHEFELTPYVGNKSTVEIDYGIKPDTTSENWGRWEVSGQLIGYTAPTSQIDAELADVLAPNSWEFYSRFNPICGQPIVVLRNRGAKPLTACTIAYKVGQGAEKTFEWTGNLQFLEADTIALDPPTWTGVQGMNTFTAEVRTTDTDEYADNNTFITQFADAPVYYPDVTFQLRTNNYAADQYEWELRKIGGDIIKQGSNLKDNTVYADTFNLENGCYEYRLINKLGYGLDFWFLRQQLGTGSLQIKSGSLTLKTFEPDFGNTAWIQFSVAPKPTVAVSADTMFFNAPSPMPVERVLAITAGSDAPLVIDTVNIVSVKNYFTIKSISKTFPATLAKGDTLFATIVFDRPDAGQASATVRIYSNDERTPVKTVRCLGNNGATDVSESQLGGIAQIEVVPHPVTSDGYIKLNVYDNSVSVTSVSIVDVLGNIVYVVNTPGDTYQWQLPSWLSSGSYSVVVATAQGSLTAPVVITR